MWERPVGQTGIMEEISDELLRAGREVLRGCMENWSDVEVLLDAHDAGLRVGGMVFVTDDRKDIVGKREVICGCLAGVAEVRRV